MARPQSISTEILLKSAMGQFWQFGYEATSVQDLQRVCGLPASSLYNRFGSKAGLFESALEQYVQKVVKRRCDKYLDPAKGLEGIYQYVASALSGPQSHWGCLLVNSQAQLERLPLAAAPLIQSGGQLVCRALQESLSAAQAQGDIAPNQPLELLAEQLAIFIQGLLIQSSLAAVRPEANRIKKMLAHQVAAKYDSGDFL